MLVVWFTWNNWKWKLAWEPHHKLLSFKKRKKLSLNESVFWRLLFLWCNSLLSMNDCNAYVLAPSPRLSASARLRWLSLSNTPHVACRAESRRQSPAVRFHSAYSLLPKRSVISILQLIMGSSASNSGNIKNHLTMISIMNNS